MKKTYDAIIIPTGEPTAGEEAFPVSEQAVKLFGLGRFGYIFVTGGYGGFSKAKPGKTKSEAKSTVEYLVKKGISPMKIYSDAQSRETLGNFTFPEVKPLNGNPRFSDFEKALVIGKEGHVWRMEDYVDIVFPDHNKRKKIEFIEIAGKHNDGLLTRIYHAGFMNVLRSNKGAEKAHDILVNNHPFYSDGWYDKPVPIRKITTAVTGLNWLLK